MQAEQLPRVILGVGDEFLERHFQRLHFPGLRVELPDGALTQEKLIAQTILGKRNVLRLHRRIAR